MKKNQAPISSSNRQNAEQDFANARTGAGTLGVHRDMVLIELGDHVGHRAVGQIGDEVGICPTFYRSASRLDGWVTLCTFPASTWRRRSL
ncbi:MAG: hypothetical protein WDM79_18070 [Terricaulis sp.]